MIPTDASATERYRAAPMLPKTISGKIRRVELRPREEAVARGEVTCVEWTDAALRGESGAAHHG